MGKGFEPEKRQRFSLRKLSIGLVSATIGSFVLLFVDAQQQVTLAEEESNQAFQLDYHYVAESELTTQEKQLLVKELPAIADVKEDAYYLVYRPTNPLPNTGEQSLLGGAAAMLGVSLLVTVVAVGRKKNKYVRGIFLLTLTGTSLLAGSALALTPDLLAQYHQTLQVRAGEALPAPLAIKGYTYLGYIKSSDLTSGGEKETVTAPKQAALQGQSSQQVSSIETQEQAQESASPAPTTPQAPAVAEVSPTEQATPASPVLPSEQPSEEVPTHKEETSPQLTPEIKEEPTTPALPPTKEVESEDPITPAQPTESEKKEEVTKPTQPSEVETPVIPGGETPTKPEGNTPKTETPKDNQDAHASEDTSKIDPSPTQPSEPNLPKEEMPADKEDTPSKETPATPVTPTLDPSPALQALEEAKRLQTEKITANDGLSDAEVADALAQIQGEVEKASKSIKEANSQEALQKAQEMGLAEIGSVNPIGKEFAVAEIDDAVLAKKTELSQLSGVSQEEKTALLAGLEQAREQVKAAIDQLADYGDTADQATAVEQQIFGLVEGFKKGLELVKPEKQTPSAEEKPQLPPSPVIPKVETPVVKEKPVLSVESITPDPANHSVEVTYQINNSSQTLVAAKTQVFKGDQLVKEVDLPETKTQVVIPELDYYTEYTLKTILLYNLGEGEKKDEVGNPARVRLEYKKLELKDIQTAELYKKEEDGYHHQLYLDQIPTDLDQYFVRIKSSKQKDSLLPVAGVTAEERDGKQVYKVAAVLPGSVTDRAAQQQDDVHFYLEKTPKAQAGVYTSFAALVEAMKADLSGTFTLGADLSADEVSLPEEAISYVPGEFTGKLIGQSNQKSYAIHHLKKPLFEHLVHATVQHLDLKSVDILSDEDTASLAKEASQSRIEDVSAQGKIKGYQNLAGLVAIATDSQLVNSSFTGNLTSAQLDNKNFLIGGLVAGLSGQESLIKQSASQVDIISTTPSGEQVIGGLVGQAQAGARVEASLSQGSIQHASDYDYIGSLIGATQGSVRLDGAIAAMDLPEGTGVIGQVGDETQLTTIAATSASPGKLEQAVRVLDADSLDQEIEKLGITTTLDDSSLLAQESRYQVDYSQVSGAQENRLQAYENIAKFLPFYNKELIVHYGNKLAETDPLLTKSLLALVPMQDHRVITDIAKDKESINRLLLHFDDGTLSYLDLEYQSDFAQTGLAEYGVKGQDLIYTPDTVLGSYDGILKTVLPALQSLDFHSQEVATTLGLGEENDIRDLYLEKAFNATKENLASELPKVLAMDKSINSRGRSVANYIQDKISQHKAAFLLGLSYLNRWYNVNYGAINAKDLLIYKLDFFGRTDTSVLDTIIALGESGFENLKPSNNVKTFGMSLAQETGQADLFAYLEEYRHRLLPDKTNNEWLKENTKAYIQERKSNLPEVRALQDNADPYKEQTIGVYDRITNTDWEDRNMLLPLLTLPEKGVYVISNLSTLDFGSYERYKDKADDGTIYTGQALNERVERLVDQAADRQRDHYDFWYKMLKPEDRGRLFRKVLVYDGFNLKDDKGEEKWVDLHDPASSIQNFFGPVGKWYPKDDSGAYANGYETHFVGDQMLGTYGTSVFTHEMVHNSDENVYFKGYGRRSGLGAEFYALGLLQSSASLQDQTITLNTIITGDEKDKDDPTRMQVLNPVERFKTREDLQEYVHGVFDAVYLLDYLEGQSIVKHDTAFKKEWLRKIENYVRKDQLGQPSYAGNNIRTYTDEEAAKINTFNDLIDQDALVRRNSFDEGKQEWNGYYTISLFEPIFAGLSNPEGTPGDIMFRRTAYELLADKGYYDGFLPYVSGQYGAEALAAGKKTYSEDNEVEVGLVTDNMVLDKVYQGKYKSFADFKKAMYQERIDKLGKLKPFTITYKLGDPTTTEQLTITSYQQLQELMDAALELDKLHMPNTVDYAGASWVHHLKEQVYHALLRSSNDFKESIFN